MATLRTRPYTTWNIHFVEFYRIFFCYRSMFVWFFYKILSKLPRLRVSWKVINSKIEQGVVIKFLIDSGEKPARIFLKLKKVFRNECASKARVFKWGCRFKEGRRSVYDDEWAGMSVTVTTYVNVNCLRPLLTTDRRHYLTTRMFSVELGINCETIHQLLHNKLHMRKLCVKLVPNAPAHSSFVILEYLEEKYIPTLPHPPYNSPDLAPCDFFLFTKLKSVLKGTRFDDLEEIKANMTHVLKALTLSDFKSGLKAWERWWNKCVIFGEGGLLWGYWGLVCEKLLNSIF